jgi:hypothetical protein
MSDVLRVIDSHVELPLPSGKTVSGQLEHAPGGRSLFVIDTDQEAIDPTLLTVRRADAEEATAALAADEVLLRNWTDLRGAPEALAELGAVELTGEAVKVGQFGLQALVARVL